jgi:hypothetical protein
VARGGARVARRSPGVACVRSAAARRVAQHLHRTTRGIVRAVGGKAVRAVGRRIGAPVVRSSRSGPRSARHGAPAGSRHGRVGFRLPVHGRPLRPLRFACRSRNRRHARRRRSAWSVGFDGCGMENPCVASASPSTFKGLRGTCGSAVRRACGSATVSGGAMARRAVTTHSPFAPAARHRQRPAGRRR